MRLTITVGESDDIGEVAADLRAAGFHVDQTLEAIGCITGSAPEELLSQLRRVPGVSDVSEEQHFQLPPPESPIQ